MHIAAGTPTESNPSDRERRALFHGGFLAKK
jgi:hypothetical protein